MPQQKGKYSRTSTTEIERKIKALRNLRRSNEKAIKELERHIKWLDKYEAELCAVMHQRINTKK